jgi:uncharacterized protein YyaL (SSP411 family)
MVCVIRVRPSLIIIAALDDPRVAELASIASTLLDGLLERPPDPNALLFLLRHFATTDQEDVREMLGEGLTSALASYPDEPTVVGRAAWLSLFRDAAALSDDARLLEAAASLIAVLKGDSHSASRVAESACAVDACLRAADLDPGGAGALIPAAVDDLERIVGRSYGPGEGIGEYADHVRAAAALVTAFELTGRLPYAMLAEELMQSIKRGSAPEGFFGIACEAARVFCRLAALHDNPDYRAAAVIAPNADYRADATRILSSLAPCTAISDVAIYGLALRELLSHTIESPDRYGY